MVDIQSLAKQLTEKGQASTTGFPFVVETLSADVNLLKISVEDREELPVFVSIAPNQLLCMSYLFKASEVRSDQVSTMNAAMLSANLAMPLSSFALLDDQYSIFGAMALTSSIDDIIHEIEVLSSNAIEAIEAMSDYLQ